MAKFPDFVNNIYVANGITYTLSTDADGNQKIKVEGLTEKWIYSVDKNESEISRRRKQ